MGGLSLGSIEQMLEECVYLCFYSRGATSLAVVALKIIYAHVDLGIESCKW
jgi:hypothetical protein